MNNNLEMPMEQMHPIISEAIKGGGEFVFYPRGKSMLPTIKPLADSVVLTEPCNIKKYDAVLYKRHNGQYVLHRVVAVKNDTFTMSGDNQTKLEKGIKAEQIIAKAVRVNKKSGKIINLQGTKNTIYSIFIRALRFPRKIRHGIKVAVLAMLGKK